MAFKTKVYGLMKGKKFINEDTKLNDLVRLSAGGSVTTKKPEKKEGFKIIKKGSKYVQIPKNMNILERTAYGKFDFFNNNPFKNLRK